MFKSLRGRRAHHHHPRGARQSDVGSDGPEIGTGVRLDAAAEETAAPGGGDTSSATMKVGGHQKSAALECA